MQFGLRREHAPCQSRRIVEVNRIDINLHKSNAYSDIRDVIASQKIYFSVYNIMFDMNNKYKLFILFIS